MPWDEVRKRDAKETGDIAWTQSPPKEACIHYDILYAAADVMTTSHPGARSMGTKLVGKVKLKNGEEVFVTSLVREMEAPLRDNVNRLRSLPILDAKGNVIQKTGLLSFGTEPNPDANNGTTIGHVIDVTRLDET